MKVLIIEDEPAAATRISKMLSQLDNSFEVSEITDSIESTVHWLKNNPAPDLIISDIHLADGSSFEVFKEMEVSSPVIFTTAYDQYAIDAFKVNSIDYLLKPVKQAELEESLQKFKKLQKQAAPLPDYNALLSALQPKNNHYQKRIVIRYGQTIKTVEIADAAYFYTQDKVTFVCTRDNKRWPIDYNLDEVETIIDPSEFYRINRQFIINIGAIDTMHAYSKSRVKITLKPASDTETIVSTERSSGFKEWLTGK